MKISELAGKRLAIWGFGREGKAAYGLFRAHLPTSPLVVIDQNEATKQALAGDRNARVLTTNSAIESAYQELDAIVKSPGISLYSPLAISAREAGIQITSLLNVWLAENEGVKKVMVTGTKGKSTTTKLIAHMLNALGHSAEVAGNIGIPVSELQTDGLDFAILEVSSYQTANMDGNCDIAVLTSLYPEHLDWHGNLDTYYRDKLNLISNANWSALNCESMVKIPLDSMPPAGRYSKYGDSDSIHFRAHCIHDGKVNLGNVDNPYLSVKHNLLNVCAALTVMKKLNLNVKRAIASLSDFQPLPHRMHEILRRNGLLFVDDSISTSVESTIAAISSYPDHPVTVILGGADRGIDYNLLIKFIVKQNYSDAKKIIAICMGESGCRIAEGISEKDANSGSYLVKTDDMETAVQIAIKQTQEDGVVLLSPAAPSYDQYLNFEKKSAHFLECIQKYSETS